MTTPLPSLAIRSALVTFECLRTLGWPAATIYFINAIDAQTGRPALMVTLQVSAESVPMFAVPVVTLDGPDRKAILDEIVLYAKLWNRDADLRQRIMNETPFDRVALVFALERKGLAVGPERNPQ